MNINIGINQADRLEIANGLNRLLADTYSLYLKTHSFHWNVTGPMFTSLHQLFEEQYTELAAAVDVIAERVRALGERALGSYSAYAAQTEIKEDSGITDAKQMLEELLEGQEIIIRNARALYPLVNQANDEATADLLTQRIQLHEKTAWMLRSLLVQ
ncbi:MULTISPECIES: DNA starvation/stationary phase protection protein DpsA [Shewanella]|jgi:starvation-inducible DNA-binding protein|uniref:DNA starvation/stationary phase protection protein n=7 Tax=Bacteria TaxID=2 RepID=A0A6G7LNW6_9GAMM|nr:MULTISPECIES: DNA starvation/stationary phase protection protein DpsA [Shewanella]AXQ14993.1 DNA starvation/stationary phase protection protein [Shewanella algae]AYV12781.1 DNA starvation/stationary phase protection protein [Shewanella algae]EKT4488969.1 DNA starvation/stationary phase protection protein [Shewanella algae]MBC8796561.1 DNA starvation/stationary phase protection protein [Shewanella algae]MBO2546836.1 DNA starvation/stationary phase protection protein [Shewanella algae]